MLSGHSRATSYAKFVHRILSLTESAPAFSTRVETRHTLVPRSQTPARSDQGRYGQSIPSKKQNNSNWLNTGGKDVSIKLFYKFQMDI